MNYSAFPLVRRDLRRYELACWRPPAASADLLREIRDGYESLDDLQREFAAAFGESYDVIDPLLGALLEQVERAAEDGGTSIELDARKDICSTASFATAMTLDMVIVSCIFALMEKSCPTGAKEADSQDDFQFLVETTSW